jgi:hypothetical protein
MSVNVVLPCATVRCSIHIEFPTPLVSREMTFGMAERVLASAEVLKSLVSHRRKLRSKTGQHRFHLIDLPLLARNYLTAQFLDFNILDGRPFTHKNSFRMMRDHRR